MLTLDNTTLFYFSLSDKTVPEEKHTAAIQDWAKKLPKRIGGTSGGLRSVTSALTKSSATHTSSSHSTRTSRSALNNGFIRRCGDDAVEVIDVDGPLSDNDETKGPERDAAIKSPLKGKKRLSSSVSKSLF